MSHRLLQNTYSLVEIGKQDQKSVISIFNTVSKSFYKGCNLINYFPVAQGPETLLRETRGFYSTVIYLPKMNKSVRDYYALNHLSCICRHSVL